MDHVTIRFSQSDLRLLTYAVLKGESRFQAHAYTLGDDVALEAMKEMKEMYQMLYHRFDRARAWLEASMERIPTGEDDFIEPPF